MANRTIESLNIEVTAEGAELKKDYKERLRESRQFAADLKAVFDKVSAVLRALFKNALSIEFGFKSSVASARTLFREVRKIRPLLRDNLYYQGNLAIFEPKLIARATMRLKEYRVLLRNIVFT